MPVLMDVGRQLSAEHLTVRYAKHLAVDDLSVSFGRGEVHALLGPNGSGKSTLIKTLGGVLRPLAGASIRVGGRAPVPALTPDLSKRLGLRFVHQDLGLIPDLTVTDNVFLSNSYPTRLGRVSRALARSRVASALEALSAEVSPSALVRTLPQSARVLVASARALIDLPEDGGFIFIDEPTASLDEHEANTLLSRFVSLARRGDVGVCLVTHRLREVRSCADELTVLRDGKVVLAGRIGDISDAELLESLESSSAPEADHASIRRQGGIATNSARARLTLQLRHLSGRKLRDISVTLRAGEILGVTGLEGSGTDELISLLYGVEAPTAGEIVLDEQPVVIQTPRDAVRLGFGLVPRERTAGALGELSIHDNILLPELRRFTRGPRLRRKEMLKVVEGLIDRLDIRPARSGAQVRTLSGGNQQKVVLARWLTFDRKLLLLHEPTAGVDIASRTRLYQELRLIAERGVSILLISSDLTEVALLSDRALVLVDGEIADELARDRLTRGNLTLASFTAQPWQQQVVGT